MLKIAGIDVLKFVGCGVLSVVGFVLTCGTEVSAQPGGAGGVGSGDYEECGRDAAEDLQGEAEEKQNQFRFAKVVDKDIGGTNSAEHNMDVLFGGKLGPGASIKDINEAYHPQLHDIKVVDPATRLAIQLARDDALASLPEDKLLIPKPTYRDKLSDSNFRLCCVRESPNHEFASTKQIAEYALADVLPDDSANSAYDGWTGMWEYYLPTTITEWSNQSGESMIVSNKYMTSQLFNAVELLAGEKAEKMAKTSIGHLVDLAESQSSGAGSTKDNRSDGGGAELKDNAEKTIKDIVKAVDEKVKDEHKFTEDISMAGGVIVRPNLFLMKKDSRQKLAVLMCMHRNQFMKVMDKDPKNDPTQRVPDGDIDSPDPEGSEEEYGILQQIPPFGSVFRNGLTFLMDPTEFEKLGKNPAGRTDLEKGYNAWKNDMLGREAKLANGLGRDWPGNSTESLPLKEVLQKAGAKPLNRFNSGQTFMEKNAVWGISSNMRYHKAPLDRREFNSFALFFRLIAALRGVERGGPGGSDRFYMKKFEPQAYYNFTGLVPKPISVNEFGAECLNPFGYDAHRGLKPDRITLSRETHGFDDSMQGESMTTSAMRSQVKEDQKRGLKNGDTPNKCRRNSERHNYAANFTIHRTCPKGWVRWKPPVTEPLMVTAVAAACPDTEKLW